MDKQGLRSELVNFVLLHPEIFDQSDFISARTFTMFTNALSSLSDLSSESSFNMIDLIAKGCFGKDTNIGNLLITFINNKLDKLMSAEEILKGDWKDVVGKLKENVFKDDMYRADIASVLTIRMINYIENNTTKKSTEVDKLIKRIDEIVSYPETLLTEDLIFNLILKLNNKYPQKCVKLILNSKIQSKMIS